MGRTRRQTLVGLGGLLIGGGAILGTGAFSSVQAQRSIALETADIDKPVNPHNFRHAAISRMYREGDTKQEIQHRVAWTLDTDMRDQYVYLSAEDMNEQIYAKAGVVEEDEAVSTERKPCGNCTEVVPPSARYCPTCGEPADPEARELQFEAESAVVDDIATKDDETDRELLRKVHDLVKTHPEVLEIV